MKVAFIGNCHADALHRVLRHVRRDDAAASVSYFRNYAPLTGDDRAAIAASDLVVRQTADFASAGDDLDTGRARVLDFPLLIAQFLWPFHTRDHPRNAEPPPPCGLPGFFTFPITDGQVLRLMKARGVGPDSPVDAIEALLDDYMALDYASLTNLDRHHDLSRAKMQRAADAVGYDIWTGIERDFRSVPTFITALNPTDAVMAALCREVLPRCGFPVSHAQVLDAFDEAYEGDALFAYEAPLHPSVARHFGLGHVDDPPSARLWCDGQVTARDLARRVVTFDSRLPVRTALGQGADTGSFEDRLSRLAAMEGEQRGNSTYFLLYGNLMARIGQPAEALRLYGEGLAVSPGHTGLARRVAAGLRQMAPPRPPVLHPGECVSFGVDGVGRALLRGAWSLAIDDDAAWLEGQVGAVCFRLSPNIQAHTAGAIALAFRARAFGGAHTAMQARVYANGQEVAVWSFPDASARGACTVRLDPALAMAPDVELTFFVSRIVRPIDLGQSQDTRGFGIGIAEMTIDSL